MPAAAEAGLEVQRAELVEAEHPGPERWMGEQIQDPVLLRLELGVGGGLPGLVVGEANAGLVEDPPELAAADGRHDPGPDQVGPELGPTPPRERLAPVSRAGEGHLHDLGPLVGIDPAWSAPADGALRVQGREALLVEGMDEGGHMRRAGLEHRADLADALALERGEQEHRPVTDDGVLASTHLIEEMGRLLVAQLTDEEFGPAGHRHLLRFGRIEGASGVRLPTKHL
jgi:hypothetical protein